MDLSEFVKQTLLQILDGVHAAQQEAPSKGAEVNPHLSASGEFMSRAGILHTGRDAAHLVQFDVALTVNEGTGTKGGIGVFAGAINLGSAGESKTESSSVSRIQFSVPIKLPRN